MLHNLSKQFLATAVRTLERRTPGLQLNVHELHFQTQVCDFVPLAVQVYWYHGDSLIKVGGMRSCMLSIANKVKIVNFQLAEMVSESTIQTSTCSVSVVKHLQYATDASFQLFHSSEVT